MATLKQLRSALLAAQLADLDVRNRCDELDAELVLEIDPMIDADGERWKALLRANLMAHPEVVALRAENKAVADDLARAQAAYESALNELRERDVLAHEATAEVWRSQEARNQRAEDRLYGRRSAELEATVAPGLADGDPAH